MQPRKLILVSLSAILVAGLVLMTTRLVVEQRKQLERAILLPEPMALPDFLLSDQDEAAFNRDSLRDRFSLLFFGFTNCPDICPTTLQQLAVVRTKLAELGAKIPDIVFVSVDPQRDTASVLKQYVGYFGEEIRGITGDLDEIKSLTDKLGIYFEYAEREGDRYNVDHSVALIAINHNAEFFGLFNAPHDIDAIVHDVQILMAGK